MWRHEDIWRTLGGGIDFITGEPLEDEWAQSSAGAGGDGMVRMAPAPLIHGAAMVATLACLFGGDTAVILPKFDPHAVWEAVQRHQVNVLSVIGDAMARPLMEALAAGGYDTSSLVSLNSTAALFSPPVKEACVRALPNVFISEAIGSTETGFAGIAFVSADDEQPRRSHGHGGPGRHRDRRGGRRVRPRADRQAGPRRARTARLLQRPGEDRADVRRGRTAGATRCPATGRGSRKTARSPCSAGATPA